jgi:hypothetical protein
LRARSTAGARGYPSKSSQISPAAYNAPSSETLKWADNTDWKAGIKILNHPSTPVGGISPSQNNPTRSISHGRFDA